MINNIDFDRIDIGSEPPKGNIERQHYFIAKMRKFVKDKSKELGRTLFFFTQTFGCQMNAHDSDKLKTLLLDIGYIETESEEKADFILYNTCCVRENAENKVWGNLGILKHRKKINNEFKIAICGCMMQQENVIETIKKKYKHIDIVFGTFNIYKLPELMCINMETNETVFDIWKEHDEIVENIYGTRKYKFKDSVNIMYGCDNFCSYCIVPYVRGRERSRKSEDIIKEIENLVSDGVKEVTLLGQNVNSYGKGLEEEITFAQLLRKINKIDGLERIRFMTSHPKDLSDELIKAMAECDKVCNHIHLPFQAGNDEILKKMNRRYTKSDYIALVEKIKKAIPDIAITTDILVGFPGETEKEIEDTIDVIKKVRFSSAFTFIYSKRTGTPAAKMENQIPEKLAKGNFNKVLDVLNPIIYEINKDKIGKVYKVLAEEPSGEDGLISGRLEDNSLVHFKGNKDIIGNIIDVKIVDCKTFYLIGECVGGNKDDDI